jgi:hypothetical protein
MLTQNAGTVLKSRSGPIDKHNKNKKLKTFYGTWPCRAYRLVSPGLAALGSEPILPFFITS